MGFEYKEWYSKVNSACLNLTDACNLKCRYCFVEQHPHFMSLDTAKDAVRFLINNLKWKQEHGIREQYVSISYFGGEPMLLYDEIIVPLTLWCEEEFPGLVRFNMTTNGTLLNKERIDFLAEHNIFPLLSMDGAPETQNFNRPCQDESKNSFDLVVKNIPYLLEKFPNVTFRSTISQYTADHIFENYLFAAAMGFKNIFMIPDSHATWTVEQLNTMSEEFQKIYSFLLQRFREGKRPVINSQPINDSFTRILQHDLLVYNNEIEDYRTFQRTPERCGVGTRGCSVAYDGKIFGCQEQDSKCSADLFYIGDIYSGINIERHTDLLRQYVESDIVHCIDTNMCEKCELRGLCKTFICPSTSWSSTGTLNTNGISYCYWMQMTYEYAAQVMHILTQENNLIFKDYLIEDCSFKRFFKEGY